MAALEQELALENRADRPCRLLEEGRRPLAVGDGDPSDDRARTLLEAPDRSGADARPAGDAQHRGSAQHGPYLAAELTAAVTRPEVQETLRLAAVGTPPERDLVEDVQVDEQPKLDPDRGERRELEQLGRSEHSAVEHERGRLGGDGEDARQLGCSCPDVGGGQLALGAERDECVARERQRRIRLGAGGVAGGQRELGSLARGLQGIAERAGSVDGAVEQDGLDPRERRWLGAAPCSRRRMRAAMAAAAGAATGRDRARVAVAVLCHRVLVMSVCSGRRPARWAIPILASKRG